MQPKRFEFERVDRLFREAVALDADDRARFLEAIPAEDAALRVALERLLAADDAVRTEPDGLLSARSVEAFGPLDADRTVVTTGSPRDVRIGHYRVKRLLAEGGMGRVYVAVQEQPRRTVALKVLRPGIASASALRRFEFESQILARLNHPNIAQVYEAGTHDDGSGGVPYFAMEYIPNAKPITEYVQARGLTTSERLTLFVKVCDAVHHGQQKGIIHRDLKPANVMVDSAGEPKVIDFGVARATDSDLAVTTVQTDVGQLVGTLQYMSPEQCHGDPHDLDTRSDVYALGVLLYEILCERLPYEVGGRTIPDALRLVQEQTPDRPSTIDRALRGDVETITLKALEKLPARRYASAGHLADDITRYLAGDPIAARPASIVYVLRTRVRRHRVPVAITAAVLMLLLTVSTFAFYQAGEHRHQKKEAHWNDIVESYTRVVEAERKASQFDIPEPASGAIELLLAVAEAAEYPASEARLRGLAATYLIRAQRVEDAEEQITRALELVRGLPSPKDALLADIHHRFGWTLQRQARYAEAETHLREAVRIRLRLPEARLELGKSLDRLGACLRFRGQLEASLATRRKVLELWQGLRSQEDVERWITAGHNNLAVSLRDLGRWAEARRAAELAVDRALASAAQGPGNMASFLRNVAALHLDLGDLDEAARAIDDAEAWTEDIVVSRRPTAEALNGYLRARLATARGDTVGAVDQCREALPDCERLDPDRRARLLDLYGRSLIDAGSGAATLVDAERAIDEARLIRQRYFTPSHPWSAESDRSMARLREAQGDRDEAEQFCRQALQMQSATVPWHPSTAETGVLLARLLLARGEIDEAAERLSQATDILMNALPAGHRDLVAAHRLSREIEERRAVGD